MAADGHLNFDTKVNTKGFDKGVSDINGGLDILKGSLGKVAVAVGAAFSVKVIVDFCKQATETAASVNALNSQFEQTFGALQGAASEAIKRVADDSGILGTRLQGVGTQIYAFAKTSGMDSVSSLNMMEEALRVAADSAAYYDRSLEDVSETLKSFLKGNYANDAALGLSVTETTRNLAANKMFAKSFTDLSEAQKQLVLLQMVKDANELSGAMGQAAREAEGWENVTGNLKESWKQLLAVVGQPVLKAATAAVQQLTGAIQYLTTQAKGAISALYDLFGWEQESTAQTSNNISDSVSAQDKLTESVKKTTKARKNQLAAFDKITKLSEQEDDDSLSAQGNMQSAALPLSGTAKLSVEADTSGAGKMIADFIGRSKKLFGSFKDYLKNNFSGTFKKFVSDMGTQLIRLKTTFGKIFSDIKKLGSPLAKYFRTDFTNLLKTCFDVCAQIVTGLFDTFNTVFSDIWDIVVFPCLSSFIKDGLPVITQFVTECVSTLGVLLQSVKTIFDTLWKEAVAPVLGLFTTVFTDVMTSIKNAWAEYGKPVFDAIREAVSGTGQLILDVWDKFGKPVWDAVIGAIKTLWKKHLKPLLDNFLGFVGDLVQGALTIYNKFILPVTKWLVDKLGPVFAKVFKGIIGAAGDLLGSVADAANGIITSLRGIIKFLTGVFTGDWKKAWDGAKQIFSGVWDAIKSLASAPFDLIIKALGALKSVWKKIWTSIKETFITVWNAIKSAIDTPFGMIRKALVTVKVKWKKGWGDIKDFFAEIWEKIADAAKTPLNTIIESLNWLLDGIGTLINSAVDAINLLSFDVPEWVPKIGGETFGFDIGHITMPQIPELAKGTVVPANYGEFLAVLGDNKREAEVVSPYSTIVDAVRDAMSGVRIGRPVTVNLSLLLQTRKGIRAVSDAVIDDINDYIDSTGNIPIKM